MSNNKEIRYTLHPERLGPMAESEMTDAQRELYTTIASGPRGGVRGPFLPLMHHPDLAMQ